MAPPTDTVAGGYWVFGDLYPELIERTGHGAWYFVVNAPGYSARRASTGLTEAARRAGR